MYAKLGQRGRRGRGSVLADAVEKAYQDSPEYKAKVAKINAERKAAYDNERLTCIECGKEHPRQKGVQFGGAESICLPCAIAHSKPGFRTGNSRAIIDASRPYEWAKDFPPVSGRARS